MKVLTIISFLCVVAGARNTGHFAQVTDIHLDVKYKVNTPEHCFPGSETGTRCCRGGLIPQSPYTLCGKWGSYYCDTPLSLVELGFQWLNKTEDLDFVLWTGDTVNHHDFDQNWDLNINELEVVTDLFYEYLPNVPVYPVLGNHDTFPIDQMNVPPFKNITNFMINYWMKPYLSPDCEETIRKGGYWTMLIRPGWRIIGLNSLYYDDNNFLYGKQTVDSAGQFEWLNKTLTDANKKSETVWIIGHIFPGAGESMHWFNEMFPYLFIENNAISFWGHSHRDQIFLLRVNEAVLGMGYVTPSFMPDNEQSSIRIYEYDRDTLEIVDYTDYIGVISEFKKSGTYKSYYSAKESYMLPDLGIKSWINFVDRMETNQTLFQNYANHMYPDSQTRNQTCVGPCKKQILCAVNYVIPADYNKCLE